MVLRIPRVIIGICMPLLLLISESHADVIFTETFGTVSANTSFTAHAAASGFDNDDLSFTGTGDLRSTTPSINATTGVSSYTGASGGANVFLTNNGTASLTISGIDTSGFESGSIELSFGAYKSTAASDLTELVVEWQVTGSETWNTLTFAAQSTGSGTASWRLISITGTSISISDDISLRFTNTAVTGGPQFRLDDITLSGVSVVPEPSTYAAIFGGLALAGVLLRRKRQAKFSRI